MISHARHRCGHWSFLNIHLLVINVNLIIKIARHRVFYYSSLGLSATKSRRVTKDVSVRVVNRNIYFFVLILNGIMKPNPDEAFILYLLKSSSLFPLWKFLIKSLFLFLNLLSYIHHDLSFVPSIIKQSVILNQINEALMFILLQVINTIQLSQSSSEKWYLVSKSHAKNISL